MTAARGPQRLDQAVATAGLARSRSAAAEAVRAGEIRVNGEVTTRPGIVVGAEAELSRSGDHHWVSRAAEKLGTALDEFGLSPHGRALDAGASTGGFTQVLLTRGCTEVYAVDVGHDQLAEPVRADPRVHDLSGVHLRDLDLELLDGNRVDLAVADVSFISLIKIAAPILNAVRTTGWALLLIKPQFEVGRSGLDKHGVVNDYAARAEAIERVVEHVAGCGWSERGRLPSRVPGRHGNQETFLLLEHAEQHHGVRPMAPQGGR